MPQRLNIVTNVGLFVADVIEKWLECNDISPEDYTSTLKIYNSCKNPVNCLSTLPMFQLEFALSCVRIIVKSKNYGFGGLKQDLLSLTSCTHNKKLLHKATTVQLSCVTIDMYSSYVNSEINFITHFNAAYCNSTFYAIYVYAMANSLFLII